MPRLLPSTHPRSVRSPSRATLRRFPTPALPDHSPVKAQLDRILASQAFRGAHRSQLFLRYILHHALAHPGEPLKEYSIAIDVFDRDASYDPAVNNTVRVEAGRLRSRLREYYAAEGHADPLLVEVPKGSYHALIRLRETNTQPMTNLPCPMAGATLRHLWAVPLALLIGVFIGHRVSR